MPTLSISDFTGKSAEYFRQVQETGEALILTESGKPVLQIAPYQDPSEEALQALRKISILHYDDPLEPVGLEDWEILP